MWRLEGEAHYQQSTIRWNGGVTNETLKGVIAGSGKGCRYLPEVIHTLKDKPHDNTNFNKPDSDSDQWIVKTFVPIRNENGSVVVVDGKVQKEEQMVEDELESKLGMAKWSNIYKTKMLVIGVFVQNKEAVSSLR